MAALLDPTQALAAPAKPVPILTYHNIGTPPDGATHPGLYLALDKFRAQLALLARHGYRGVSMDEGLPFLRGERQGRVAIITFDDGYLDNLELALPALREHGFSATCYLVAEHIGGFNAWDSEKLRVRKPLMDLPRIRDWLAGGMKIGSHTLTHPHLTRIEPAISCRIRAGSMRVRCGWVSVCEPIFIPPASHSRIRGRSISGLRTRSFSLSQALNPPMCSATR